MLYFLRSQHKLHLYNDLTYRKKREYYYFVGIIIKHPSTFKKSFFVVRVCWKWIYTRRSRRQKVYWDICNVIWLCIIVLLCIPVVCSCMNVKVKHSLKKHILKCAFLKQRTFPNAFFKLHLEKYAFKKAYFKIRFF